MSIQITNGHRKLITKRKNNVQQQTTENDASTHYDEINQYGPERLHEDSEAKSDTDKFDLNFNNFFTTLDSCGTLTSLEPGNFCNDGSLANHEEVDTSEQSFLSNLQLAMPDETRDLNLKLIECEILNSPQKVNYHQTDNNGLSQNVTPPKTYTRKRIERRDKSVQLMKFLQ